MTIYHLVPVVKTQANAVLEKMTDLKKMINHLVESDAMIDHCLFATQHGTEVLHMDGLIEQVSKMVDSLNASPSLKDSDLMWRDFDKENFRMSGTESGDGEELWKMLEPFAPSIDHEMLYKIVLSAFQNSAEPSDVDLAVNTVMKDYQMGWHVELDKSLVESFDVDKYLTEFLKNGYHPYGDLHSDYYMYRSGITTKEHFLESLSKCIIAEFVGALAAT